MYTNGIAIAEFRCINLESILLDGISVVCEKPITCGSNHSEIVFGAYFSGFAGPSREGVGSIEKKMVWFKTQFYINIVYIWLMFRDTLR